MTTSVATIETSIRQLQTSDLAQFRKWFVQFDAKSWDEQIEIDASSGKLDTMAHEALVQFRAGMAKAI